ncbi:prenyltransferase/squalene oxidase repeat-containing protein [Kitasatospora sp. NPDC096077]|uniref:prenyltransferase/squalene oxidase repeat-containing protein n=1 Tax=Kitasatospora sp. NPDC096077 TaxID=3155544 RepID=UPI0033248CB8
MNTTQTHRTYAERAGALVARVDRDDWGSVRPSLYETARVTSAAPWLPGESRRLAHLLAEQAPDGSWGEGPEPYRLLPTLSAVEAALAVLLRGTASAQDGARLAAAADRGLAALRALPTDCSWPDTAAAEILVPGLVAGINEHLERAAAAGLPRLGPWHAGPRLAVPHGYHEAAPAYVARKYASAGRLPVKFHHTFEGVAGYLPQDLIPEIPEAAGLLGSSPAATAAVAAVAPAAVPRAIADLEAVAQRYDGLFPEAAPILVFERLWVATALARAGLPAAAVETVRSWVDRIYDPAGVRGAPGLMVDADDTAMAVLVASLVGRPYDPAPLELFHNGGHYDCYVGEDTGSVTANAHALQALDGHLRLRPDAGPGHRPRIHQLSEWLVDVQQPEGHWHDKWHASPYYATERCVTALARHGGDRAGAAVDAAATWTLNTQREDGSWGIWGGTAEETAYAVQILLCASARSRRPRHDQALDRAALFLESTAAPGHRHPALWHDKTLYAPGAMIEAEVLAARELLRARHDSADRRATAAGHAPGAHLQGARP